VVQVSSIWRCQTCRVDIGKGMAEDIRIIMKTNRGEIHATLLASEVPITAANWLNLAKRGFYDGVTFHRVINNFMIQGGDPDGTGRGGPGYRFEDEFKAGLRHDKPGIWSMANAGPGTNGSQFFITHVPTPHLDMMHTVFGHTSQGQDVIDSIEQGDRIESVDVIDSVDVLFEEMNDVLAGWNKILDRG